MASFDYNIFYVKPLYLDDTVISVISKMCCSICQKYTSDMMKFKCCGKFTCCYCKDKAHLCAKIKKLSNLGADEVSIYKKTEYSCCYYLSGCKQQLNYQEISSHAKDCNYKYFIPDEKIEIYSANINKSSILTKPEKESFKYLCMFCNTPPLNLFLTNCCFRCICSYCGYTNKNNKKCLCNTPISDSQTVFTIINPVDNNIEEYIKQPIFKCTYKNCKYIGNQLQLNKHLNECVEGYCNRKFGMTEPNEYYNFEFSIIKEINLPNYLEEDYQSPDKKYPKTLLVRSLLKLSSNLIAIGANYGEIDCWNEKDNTRVWSTKEHSSFIYTMIKLDDTTFVSAEWSENATAIVWEYDMKMAIVKKKVNLMNSGAWIICFIEPDLIACGMENSSILIWDLYDKYNFKAKEIEKEMKKGKKNKKQSQEQKPEESNNLNIKNKICIHTKYVKSLIYLKSKDLLLSGGADGKIITTKLSTSGFSSTESFNMEHKGVIMCLCNFNDEFLASSDDKGVIKIWKFDTKESCKTILIHTNTVTRLIYFEPKILISSSLDKTIKYISVDDQLNFSVIKTIDTKEPVWAMINQDTYKSFTVISYNSSLITTYSNN